MQSVTSLDDMREHELFAMNSTAFTRRLSVYGLLVDARLTTPIMPYVRVLTGDFGFSIRLLRSSIAFSPALEKFTMTLVRFGVTFWQMCVMLSTLITAIS